MIKSSWLYNGPIANTQIVEDVKSALKLKNAWMIVFIQAFLISNCRF